MNSVFCADIGTSSLKAALIDFSGRVLAFSRVQFGLFYTDHAAGEWLGALRKALGDCIASGTLGSFANAGASGTGTSGANICDTAGTSVLSANAGASGQDTQISIDAICISGNGPTLCGRDGQTLLWNADICDTDGTNVLSANTGASGTGTSSANTKSLYIPRILGFAKRFPSYWQQKDSIVFSGPEYLIYLLTGASVSILPEKRFLEAYWSKGGFEEAGLSAEDAEGAMQKLPAFVPPASIAGSLTKTAAEFLCGGEGECAVGLVKDGIPVVCGAPDFISALVGTNTLRAGLFCDRAGSSEGINLCTSKPVAGQGIRTLPSIIPGLWNASVLLPESGERFCAYKEKISRLYARPISLDDMVQILLQSDGSLAELDQGKYLMLQTAMMVRDGLNALRRAAEESGGVPALKTEMTVTGGQAENALWNQMKANVTGYTVYTQSLVHAELTGDAVFALLALGLYKDIHSAAAAVCKRDCCYEPQEVIK
ncbi:MAG: hypothetical protein J6X11_02135 [Treponema sp.]|nr:hypothetical protein [Treponema sp.]